MKSLLFVFVSLILWCQALYGQKYDYNWISGNPNNNYSIEISFDSVGLKSVDTVMPTLLYFAIGYIAISDEEGELRFYTNGNYIADSSHQLMLNSKGLNEGSPWAGGAEEPYIAYCYNCFQVVPDKFHSDEFYMLHSLSQRASDPDLSISSAGILITKVNVENNNGKGEVVYKNHKLYNKETSLIIRSILHGNGKDWWVLLRSTDGSEYIKLLLSRDSLTREVTHFNIDPTPHLKTVTDKLATTDFGFNVSPDGSLIVERIGRTYIRVLHFDRCTGEITFLNDLYVPIENYKNNSRHWHVVCFSISPNNKYLYGWGVNGLYQWDLTVEDISASMLRIFTPPLQVTIDERELDLPLVLLPSVYGPDGKLYFLYYYNHYVVNRPNERGHEAIVEGPRALPVRAPLQAPNYPNYRLGPLKGSPCDTLISSSPDRFKSSRFTLYPNPTAGPVTVELDLPEWGAEDVYLSIRDAIGREVYKQSVPRWSYRHEIETGGFPAGTYFVSLEMSGAVVHTERIVVY